MWTDLIRIWRRVLWKKQIAFPAIFVFLWSVTLFAGPGGNLYVPAEFVRELTLPGSGNHFLRPSRILIDRNSDEVLIADPGNNRVVIFDRGGIYNFEFSVGNYCGAPADIAVDSDGKIYLLGSTSQGKRIFVFDYDGLFLHDLKLLAGPEGFYPHIESIAIDNENRLFAYDGASYRMLVFDTDGRYLREFPIFSDIAIDEKAEIPPMPFTVNDEDIYIPAPILGTVYHYDREGNLRGIIGHRGTTMGELNFPVSVTVTKDDITLILDKHRFLVVCFSRDGRFLGEFGGKGMGPGWFYHPSWMDVDPDNRVYIGQIYDNRIQICDLPDFIKERNGSLIEIDRPDE